MQCDCVIINLIKKGVIKMQPKENVVFRLDPDKKVKLDKAAEDIGVTRSALLQLIIDDYLGKSNFDRHDLWHILSLVTKEGICLSKNLEVAKELGIEAETISAISAIKRNAELKNKIENILYPDL